MSGNSAMNAAKEAKQDEFYTQPSTVEEGLEPFRGQFKGKTIYCNCDNPFKSNFFKYFAANFNALGLRKLLATCYDGGGQLCIFPGDGAPRRAHVAQVTQVPGDYAGDVGQLLAQPGNALGTLEGSGDFRSPECLELLKRSDIVCTNPPFSLFLDYFVLLVKHGKSFLVLGNLNAATKNGVFSHIVEERTRILRAPSAPRFDTPGGKPREFTFCCWYTNLDTQRHRGGVTLVEDYDPRKYPKYDNFDAINVDRTARSYIHVF